MEYDKPIILRYTGESDPLYFMNGQEYVCLGEEYDMYIVVDETDDYFLYNKKLFEVVEDKEEEKYD